MRSGRRDGRIANVVPLLAVASAATLLLAIPASNAGSHDASATAIADGLRTFSDRLEQADDALGDFQALAESLPLTSLAPGGDEALRMSRLFREQVGDKLAATYTSLDELASDIESFDDTGAVNGVLGQFGDVTHTSSGTFVDFTIPFSATRTVAVPLDFDADVDGAGGTSQLVVDRGSLSFQFEVSTSLTLRLNTALLTTAPAEAISILGTPQLNLCARADASIASFLVRFGFTDVSISTDDPATPATETAKVNACARVQFSDPDSDGVITQAEWASHSLSELMTASLVDGTAAGGVAAPDVAAKFYVDASLIPGTPDGNVEFADANLAATPAMVVTPTFTVLDDFDNITPLEVAQGLAQFAGAIAGAQTSGNGPLPFIEESLSKAFDAASPIVTYAKRLTDANVVCGTAQGAGDADAPTGSTAFLAHGADVYCRATTALSVKTDSAAWSSTNATAVSNTANPGSNSTIGATPSDDAHFTMNCPGGPGSTCTFAGQVDFTVNDPDGTGPLGETDHVAIPKPLTAEALFAELADAAGLSATLSQLAFNPTTRALTFRLVQEDYDFDPVTVGVDFGDKLRGATNLGGLESDLTAHTGAELTAEDLEFDLTFGVILLPNLADITPGATGDNPSSTVDDAPELLDRFFVKSDATEPELALGSLDADVTVDLSGRIGFLEVEAAGDATQNPAGGADAFTLGKADTTKPVVRIDVKTPDAPLELTVNGSPQSIANAIGIEDLLFNLNAAHLEAECNLKMSAGLSVSATLDGAELASGGVSVDWPTVFEADSCTPDFDTLAVDADADFEANLQNFDPFPQVEGTATGGDVDTLIDAATNFVAKGNLLDLTLRNKTTGATCHILTFGATDINCVSALAGGSRPSSPTTANQFVAGDEYVVEGNAFGMLHLILDRLDDLVDQLDALGVDVDAQLPLADVSTRDLVAKIREIKRTIDDLRGFPAATIKCGLNAPDMAHADPWDDTGENVAVVPDGTTVHCNARSVETYTSASWEQTEGGSATLEQTSSPTTVGPNPGGTFSFTVSDGSTDDPFTTIDEWEVKLTFANAGGSHTAWFPVRQPPQSLQDLEALIEDSLDVGDILDLDLLDLPDPGQAPKKSGTADSIAVNVLTDSGADFDGNGVEVGMLLVNKTENLRCTITARSDDTVTCATMTSAWTSGDAYDVVGDGTKDLVIDLHTGFCAEGSTLCQPGDVAGPALQVPLEVPFVGPNTLVSVSTAGELSLQYGIRASLELGIPLELGLPSVVVVDGTRAEADARLAATNLGLEASVGPIGVALGSLVTDLDSDNSTPEPETPAKTALLGAGLEIYRDGTDDGDGTQEFADGNQTYSLGSFFALSNVTAELGGSSQECVPSSPGPAVAGDACAALSIAVNPQSDPAFGYMGNVSITCDIPDVDLTSGSLPDPLITCAEPTLPPLLSALINGEPLNWSMLIQVLPRLLESLEQKLDGAAQNMKLPVVGDALDGGAQVVNTFRTQVVQPFANLSAQITNTVDAAPNGDADGIAEPDEVAKKVRDFVWTEIGGPEPNFIRDLNGDGSETIDDVVVTAVCDTGACADGQPIEAIDDLRITFLLGQGYDVQLPFDLGLDGVPLRLQGNVGSAGSWSLLVDFGLSRDDGPYLVQSGKKTIAETADTKHDGAADSKNLIDAGGGFTSSVEAGMYLQNLTDTTACVVTRVVSNTTLSCDVASTAAVEGLDWDVDDQYRVVRRHAPNVGSTGSEPEFTLTADATLRDAVSACSGDPGAPAPYNTNRCIRGELGFLAVTLRDAQAGDGVYNDATPVGPDGTGAEDDLDRTKVAIAATIDIKRSSGSGDKITFADLVGNTTIVPGFSVTANVDVRVKTGFRDDEDAGLPSVVGAFHLYWGLTANTETGIPAGALGGLQIVFDGLAIDLGSFISDFLEPIVKEVKNVTKPLMPVIETLQAPLPIISDLSVATGGDPITLLDIIEAVSGNDLSLLRSVIQFVQFANRLPTDTNLVVGLGALGIGGKFRLSGATAAAPAQTPDQQRSLQVVGDTNKNLINGISGATTAPADARPGTFGVAGLTFPIFADASNVFQVLLGKDVTLVRYDAGTLRAAAGVSYTFGPFMAGPIPVTITIGGSVEIRGRFAIGYDTSGLRKVLEGGTGEHLLDGIFIDDLDANGNDVPEIQFIGTVFAEGAASIYIISVGVRGELIFTTNLDLDDRPNPDGKLYIEEIINRLSNPICLFVVSGSLDAQLSAFVEIDLFFFTKRFTIVIVRVTLLKFEVKCEPEVPDLARVDGSTLILHAGPLSRRELRNVQESNENEKFTVRQMEEIDRGPPGDSPEDVVRFTVSAFGIHEEEFLPAAAVDGGTARIDALGDGGNDNFTFVPGADGGTSASDSVTVQPFSVRVEANMGLGNDEIKTGDANDTVTGGPASAGSEDDNDEISTGAGNDTINGGDKDDSIDAGPGNDTNVRGGAGNDTISGGDGGDTIYGEAGDDNLGGAGGTPANDGGDVIIGGPGSDTLAGVSGDDVLRGDDDSTCAANTTNGSDPADQVDSLDGGPGDDQLFGGPDRDQVLGGPDVASELLGDTDDDLVCGNNGNDEIGGGLGKDIAYGGDGSDTIEGGQDNSPAAGGGDVLNGGNGNDYVLGDLGAFSRPDPNAAPTITLDNSFVGHDTINGDANDDTIYGQAGGDTITGGANTDTIRGGTGQDTIQGNDGGDTIWGDQTDLAASACPSTSCDDLIYGADSNPTANPTNAATAAAGADGSDTIRGGYGADEIYGDEAGDFLYGDSEADEIYGGLGTDLIRGNGEADVARGNENDDDVYGDAGDDHLEGNENDATPLGDELFGNADQDDILGGTDFGYDATPNADGGDTIQGNQAQDVIVGDNGQITRPGGDQPDGTHTRTVTLENPGSAGGADDIEGNEEDDDVYGGGADDEINGNAGDDYVEGNGGADDIFGDGDQDDLIGGTSQGGGGVADAGADQIQGDAGHDVIAGDNASIVRTGGGTCDGWTCNTFSGAVSDVVIRGVVLYDVGTASAAAPAGTSDGDTINGNDGHDRIYAGGGADTVHGDGGDDFVYGNDGGDQLFGDDGQDDLVGGTGRSDTNAATSAVDGRLDGADTIDGGADFDSIAGDNALVVRSTTGSGENAGLWVANTFNGAVTRTLVLLDVGTASAAAAAGTSGNDLLLGQGADDTAYGQAGNDGISGGDGNDFLEGNANGTGDAPKPDPSDPAFAGDLIHGNADSDDIAGGTGRIWMLDGGGNPVLDPASGVDGRLDGADWIAGDAGADSIAGDNAVVERALVSGAWVLDDLRDPDALDVVRRIVRLRDVATADNAAPLTNGTSGGDTIAGNDGFDVAYGQGGDDAINGNDGDDVLAGNAGADTIHGDAGQDDIAGGTGRTVSNDAASAVDGRTDAADTLYGDAGEDVVYGDNATVDRFPFDAAYAPAGLWQLDTPAAGRAENVVRRVTRALDVATVGNGTPLGDGSSGGDTITGDDGFDVVYGQGGNDDVRGNQGDDRLEGNAGADTLRGDNGQDDVIGGTGRVSSDVPGSAADGRVDGNDAISGGDGTGGVGSGDDFDVLIGDNGTIDRTLGASPTLAQLPSNGAWSPASWNDSLRRAIRLYDVGVSSAAALDASTSGDDTIRGEADDDVVFGQGANDTIEGDNGEDYLEGNAADDRITGDLGQDDITGGGSANDGILDANRDGRLDDDRVGETLRDGIDTIDGDSAEGAVGDGDVIAGDNARIQRLLASGAWRQDSQRGTRLRDVFLFDVEKVGGAGGFTSAPSESGPDNIYGNGGPDLLFGQDNGALEDAHGTEGAAVGAANCQNATSGPGSTAAFSPAGDDDGDQLPDLNDPQCRDETPGDWVDGQSGGDYIEGNHGSDTLWGRDGEDDIVGGSSSNNGHVNATLPPADRDAPLVKTPEKLKDGHDVIEGNAEDDAIVADNAFVDRYLGTGGAWKTIAGGGVTGGGGATAQHPAHAAYGPYALVRRDVTMVQAPDAAGAFGSDLARGGAGHDDVYGQQGSDWLEGNEDEDAIVGDLGKVVNNLLGVGADDVADPAVLDRFIEPKQPFLDDTIDRTGVLKREVTLYALDQTKTVPAPVFGHDVALGGSGNDWIHTGAGEDLANGNQGDDRIFVGDSAQDILAVSPLKLAHDQVDAAWGGPGHDHLYGGYGADFLDVRPRTGTTAPGILPGNDPATWFQVAGPIALFADKGDFEGFDFIYGGWDQDALQANEGGNGPVPGDRMIDWAGAYNAYYLCPSTYGDWVSTRALDPGMVTFLQDMSQGDGAVDTKTPGSSGFRELGIVFANQVKDNTKPIHPDTPAHFTCGTLSP